MTYPLWMTDLISMTDLIWMDHLIRMTDLILMTDPHRQTHDFPSAIAEHVPTICWSIPPIKSLPNAIYRNKSKFRGIIFVVLVIWVLLGRFKDLPVSVSCNFKDLPIWQGPKNPIVGASNKLKSRFTNSYVNVEYTSVLH